MYNFTPHLCHKTDNEIKMIEKNYYQPYCEILGNHPLANVVYRKNCIFKDSNYKEINGGEYYKYYSNSISHENYVVCEDLPKRMAQGGPTTNSKKFTDKPCACVTDTREHLENWKYFVYNNKLPLFIVIVILIAQNNIVIPYVPWLVDKHYTDEEISEIFGFTQEEIDFIDYVLKKYERHSPWFKRFMCGEDSVTNEEINNYIQKIKNKEL